MLIPKQESHCHARHCLARGFHQLSKMSHYLRLQILIFLFQIKGRKDEYGQINDTPSTSKKRNITPSSLELHDFYKRLLESGKPVLLSLVPTYSKAYGPLYELGVLPKPLSDHFKEEYLELSYPDPLSQCESCYDGLTITASQSEAVEKKTKQQTGSRGRFQLRAGRITASRIRAAAHTDPTQPSPSLIKSIYVILRVTNSRPVQQHGVVSMNKLPEMHMLQWQKKNRLGYLFHQVDW